MAHNFWSEVTVLGSVAFTSAAATGIIESSVIDSSPYESVVCLAPQLGSTGSSNGLMALMGTASASANLSEVLNSYVSGGSSGAGLELHRPMRYVQFQLQREASAKAGNLVVLGYRGRIQPATQSTALFSVRTLASPSTGQTTSTA